MEASDQLAGSISARVVGDVSAQVGFWIAPAYRRKGHATAALQLVTGWAFGVLQVHLVSMLTDLDNVASQRVAARAGFSNDGVVTNYELGPGIRRDVILWSRTAAD